MRAMSQGFFFFKSVFGLCRVQRSVRAESRGAAAGPDARYAARVLRTEAARIQGPVRKVAAGASVRSKRHQAWAGRAAVQADHRRRGRRPIVGRHGQGDARLIRPTYNRTIKARRCT